MAVAQVNNVGNTEGQKLQYGRVILMLENCILPPDKTTPTPSLTDGLDPETEMDLRILGCELIQTSGILLRLPQVAMATGQVLFQRFYYSKSFVRHSMEIVAMACVTLASKIEEAPRRIRDVINVFHHIKQVRSGNLPHLHTELQWTQAASSRPSLESGAGLYSLHTVLESTDILTSMVCMATISRMSWLIHKQSYTIIVTLLEVLKCKNQKLMQTAWNYMNDSLRTNVFVRYHPETIACACIYLSARLLKMPLPNKPPWFLIFNVTEESIQDICHTILCLYARRKTDPEKLEKTVEELRKAHQEAKLKAKGISGNSTPTPKANVEFSPASRHNSPKQDNSPSNIKKEKNGHGLLSPKNIKELNHISQLKRKQISPSPSKSPSPRGKKEKSESSSRSVSHSPSPKRRAKTPPRSYKAVHQIRSRSRTREVKESSKHRSYHKRRKSHSRSRSKSHSRSPHRHSKKREREKARHVSRSHSRERTHHSNLYEKPHKSRKERNKDISNHRNHSREHSRR